MHKIYTSVLAACILALSQLATAQESRTAYDFLCLPCGVREAALGTGQVAIIEDDASLVFTNPALLYGVSDKTVSLATMTYMSGSLLANASYCFNVGKHSSVAISGQLANYGSMAQTDAENNQLGEFSAKDIALSGHYAYMLGHGLTGGIAARFITSHIAGYNSVAVGVDLGLNYYLPKTDWSFSLVIRNLGGQLKAYDDNYERMPVDLLMGLSHKIPHTPFRISISLTDLTHLDYSLIKHAVLGADILLGHGIWIGGGYNFRRADEMSIPDGETMSSHGAGWSFGGGIQQQRFSFGLAWGKYHVSSSSLLLNVSLKI